MKKLLCIIIVLAISLTLCACGLGGNSETYSLGETVSTDIVEFTLNRTQLAVALVRTIYGSDNYDGYGIPKEYDAKEDYRSPYVASTGHTFLYINFTIKNLDRNEMVATFDDVVITDDILRSVNFVKSIKCNGEKYDEINGGEILAVSGGEHWHEPDYSNQIFLWGGSSSTCRGYVDLTGDIGGLDTPFSLTIQLLNSSGDYDSFTYDISTEDIVSATELEYADIKAALREWLIENGDDDVEAKLREWGY